MTTGGPWSVKGIDPKAREIAKDLARRSGMTLGEWLNHMIVEGGDDGPEAETPYERPWLDVPRTRSAATGFSATESLRARLGRDVGGMRDYGARDYGAGVGHNSEAGELQRIGKALAELSQRLESTENRSTLAISGVDQALMGVLGRVEGAEREQTAVAARFDVAIEDVRSGQIKLTDRLRRFDCDEAARMEAIKALEGALTKVAGQIYEGEGRARTQMSELREDVSALARRVDRTDAGPEANAAERRLEAIAADLTARVEQVRAEVAGRAQEQSDGKLDRLEGAIREIATQVGASEKRSGEAIDRMGREVMRVAQAMSSRVQAVETRSAKASDQMGSEMARIAEAMEGRMRRADAAQAESLEKLGGEIARIAEKLAERIATSERRSSGAITHMGDQLSGVTDAFNQRHEKSSADIAERIRMSEERTAKLLADTRETIDRRLAETHRRQEESPVLAPAPPPSQPPFAGPDAFGDPFGGDPFGGAPPAADRFGDFPVEESFAGELAFAAPATAQNVAPDQPEVDAPRRGTRDLIASARAAARSAAESRGRRGPPAADTFAEPAAFPGPGFGAPGAGAQGFGAAEFVAPDPVDAAADRARTGALGFGFALPRRKKKEGPTLKTLLMASGVAAALSVTAVGAVGLVALDGRGDGKRDAADAPSAAPKPELAAQATETQAPDAPLATPESDAAFDRLADAATAVPPPATPAPVAAPAATKPVPAVVAPVAPAVVQPAPRALYADAVHRLETGDLSGLDGVKKAANLGYAPAEFYLAKLFEGGTSGVRKDAAEARRWTERAAQAGDAKAMHNLALYWFEGAGGPKDPAQAADWFKRAAERGVQDSQYNLARLYEQGFGVGKNAAEAYKWYLVAGSAGDAEARNGAEAVKRQLPPETQTSAERAAAAFKAQIAASQLRTAAAE